jgi:hemoglobin-like flavoprotein
VVSLPNNPLEDCMALNVSLIRESFGAVKPHALIVVDHFYVELFTRYPGAKGLFKNANMERQKLALANGLAHIVEFLEDEDHLPDYLKKMGARHVPYGAKPEHFNWVGESLLATFEYFFDSQWTPELKQTWSDAFGVISGFMIDGMNNASKNPYKKISNPSRLTDNAESLAKQSIVEALENYLKTDEFQKIIQNKAQDLLNQAIEAEAKDVISKLKSA